MPLPKKGDSQDELNTRARDTVLADPAVKARWLDLAQRRPTEKNPQRTLLDKQLEDYTQKNKTDYFIHKDLGGFLRRELDFYIKNEVMHLDDVQNATVFADIEKNLRLIQCLRAIALDLVAFLAQLEDFQKKLWLKKKFVVEAHYCLTLDRLYSIGDDLKPTDKERPGVLAEREWLLAQIAANPKQIASWIDLGLVKNTECEPVVASTDTLFAQATTVAERLRANPFLMVDTQWFPAEFKYRLLAQLHDLDAQCDGLLVYSENFQALRLLQTRYTGHITHVFTDPPYNTGIDGFPYKDNYQHSSWLCCIKTRIEASRRLLSKRALFFASIDYTEVSRFRILLDEVFGVENFLADIAWEKRYTRSNNAKRFYSLKDTVLAYRSSDLLGTLKEQRSEKSKTHYTNPDNDTRGAWISSSYVNPATKEKRPNLVYPITNPFAKAKVEHPTHAWKYDPSTHAQHVSENRLYWGLDGAYEFPRLKSFLSEAVEGMVPVDVWSYDDTGTTDDGGKALKSLFGTEVFDNPKPITLVQRGLSLSGGTGDSLLVLDPFAGSGTTGHAVIDLNRSLSGRRNYILAEMGQHFYSVILPRIAKVVFSSDWKDGKPTSANGLSHCFKYLRLESYEDTLNNLALQRPEGLTDLFDPAGKEDYLLHYMLNVESRASLLSVQDFKKPFDYKLRIATDSAGACQTKAVDLVETFNYLLGLRVAHLDAKLDLGYLLVSGKLPNGQSCLIVWRDCLKLDYEATSRLLERHKITPNDNEYDVVYINGDHNIPTIAQATEAEGGVTRQLTLRQIEPEFLARMFTGEEA